MASVKIDFNANLSELKRQIKEAEKTTKQSSSKVTQDLNKLANTYEEIAKDQKKFATQERKRKDELKKQLREENAGTERIKQVYRQYYREREQRAQRFYKQTESELKNAYKRQNTIVQRSLREREQMQRRSQSRQSAGAGAMAGALQPQALLAGGGLMGAIPQLAAVAGVVTAIQQLGAALSDFAEKARETETALAQLRTVINPAQWGVVDEMADAFQDAAIRTGQSVNDMIEAAQQALGSGRGTVETVNEYIEQMGRFATTMGTTVSSAENIIGEALLAWDMDVSQATELMDLFSATTLQGSIPSMEALGTSIERASVPMRALGLDLEDVTAMMTSMTSQGFQLEHASRAFDTMSQYFQDINRMSQVASLGVLEGFDMINGQVTDTSAFMQSLSDIYAENQTALLSIFPSPQFVKLFDTLFDTTGKGFVDMRQQMEDVSGTFDNMWISIQSTQQFQLDQMEEQWTEVQRSIGAGWSTIQVGFQQFVTDLFLSGTQQSEFALQRLQLLTEQVNQFRNVLSTGINLEESLRLGEASDSQVNAFFQSITQNMQQINEVSPYVANNINDILGNENYTTLEQIELINEQLGLLEEKTAFDRQREAVEALNQSMQDSGFDQAIDAAGTFQQIFMQSGTIEAAQDLTREIQNGTAGIWDYIEGVEAIPVLGQAAGVGLFVKDLVEGEGLLESIGERIRNIPIIGGIVNLISPEVQDDMDTVDEITNRITELQGRLEQSGLSMSERMTTIEELGALQDNLDAFNASFQQQGEVWAEIALASEMTYEQLVQSIEADGEITRAKQESLDIARQIMQEREQELNAQLRQEEIQSQITMRMEEYQQATGNTLSEVEALNNYYDEQNARLEEINQLLDSGSLTQDEVTNLLAEQTGIYNTLADIESQRLQIQQESTEEIEQQLTMRQLDEQLGGNILQLQGTELANEKATLQARMARLTAVKTALDTQISQIRAMLAGEQAMVNAAQVRANVENQLIEIYNQQQMAQMGEGGAQVTVDIPPDSEENVAALEALLVELEESSENAGNAIESMETDLNNMGGVAGNARNQLNQLNNVVSDLASQTADVEFQTSIMGLSQDEQQIAEENRRYELQLQEMREQYGNNAEMIQQIEALHQARLNQIRQTANRERQQERLQSEQDTVNREVEINRRGNDQRQRDFERMLEEQQRAREERRQRIESQAGAVIEYAEDVEFEASLRNQSESMQLTMQHQRRFNEMVEENNEALEYSAELMDRLNRAMSIEHGMAQEDYWQGVLEALRGEIVTVTGTTNEYNDSIDALRRMQQEYNLDIEQEQRLLAYANQQRESRINELERERRQIEDNLNTYERQRENLQDEIDLYALAADTYEFQLASGDVADRIDAIEGFIYQTGNLLEDTHPDDYREVVESQLESFFEQFPEFENVFGDSIEESIDRILNYNTEQLITITPALRMLREQQGEYLRVANEIQSGTFTESRRALNRQVNEISQNRENANIQLENIDQELQQLRDSEDELVNILTSDEQPFGQALEFSRIIFTEYNQRLQDFNDINEVLNGTIDRLEESRRLSPEHFQLQLEQELEGLGQLQVMLEGITADTSKLDDTIAALNAEELTGSAAEARDEFVALLETLRDQYGNIEIQAEDYLTQIERIRQAALDIIFSPTMVEQMQSVVDFSNEANDNLSRTQTEITRINDNYDDMESRVRENIQYLEDQAMLFRNNPELVAIINQGLEEQRNILDGTNDKLSLAQLRYKSILDELKSDMEEVFDIIGSNQLMDTEINERYDDYLQTVESYYDAQMDLAESNNEDIQTIEQERIETVAELERRRERELLELRLANMQSIINQVMTTSDQIVNIGKSIGESYVQGINSFQDASVAIDNVSSGIGDAVQDIPIIGDLLSAGFKGLGRIIKGIGSLTKDNLTDAERMSISYEYQNKLLDGQRSIMQSLKRLGGERLDDAEELQQQYEKELDALIKMAMTTTEAGRDFTDASEDDLTRIFQANQQLIAQRQKEVSQIEAEYSSDIMRKNQGAFWRQEEIDDLERENDIIQQILGLYGNIYNTERLRYDEQLKQLDISERLEGSSLEINNQRIAILENMIEATDESGELLYSEEEILEYQSQILELRKQNLETFHQTVLQQLELNGIARDSIEYKQEEISIIQTQLGMADELGLSQTEINQLKIDQLNLEKDILDKQREQKEEQKEYTTNLFESSVDEIEHRKKMGEFEDNEIEYFDEKIKRLSFALKLIEGHNENVENEQYTREEIWAIEEEIVSLEDERLKLLNQQTEEMMEQGNIQDDELDRLVRKRQEMIRLARESNMLNDPDVQAQLIEVESEIVSRMRNNGIDEEVIASAVTAMREQRSFQKGGYIPETESIMAHKGEYMIPAIPTSIVDDMAPGMLESLRRSTTPEQVTSTIQEMSNSISNAQSIINYYTTQNNTSIDYGDTNNAIDIVWNANDKQTVDRLMSQLKRVMPSLVDDANKKRGIKEVR